MGSLDPLALWAALAAVAAITSAIQASATFTLSARVDQLEDVKTTPGSAGRREQKKAASRTGKRLGAMNLMSFLLSAGVVVSWANITFERVPCSWVFIVPWATVCGATILLAAFGVFSLGIRTYKLASQGS